jgi:16S rRNA (guanine966-N2)-methyltransferase
MRVIAGKFRNRSLRVSDHFRPTTDRVRETLFNVLQNDLKGSIFVDAYAGSGAVGIEALSRGAAMAYFLETNRKSLQVLESNLIQCCKEEKWRILPFSVKKGMAVVRNQTPSVQFLFFDPPYNFESYSEILELAATLFPESLLILEFSTRTELKVPPVLDIFKEKKIGETRLIFFQRN